MSKQTELDAIFKRLSTEYNGLSRKQQEFAIAEIGRVRGEMALLLAEYADSDGIIKRQRMNRLLRDLDEIERNIRKYGTIALDEIITDTAEWTTAKLNGAMTTAVGSAVAVASFDRINRDVFRYVTKRFGSDGLILSDRVWDLSGGIRDEMASAIRSSILRGEGINTMVAKVRDIHENETWKIRRLARTEGVTAYRTATAFNAERSDVVKYVQLHDGVCGRKDHADHRCHVLASADEYGQGAGIYLPTDSDIYSPHPQCTSYISYVLDERYL